MENVRKYMGAGVFLLSFFVSTVPAQKKVIKISNDEFFNLIHSHLKDVDRTSAIDTQKLIKEYQASERDELLLAEYGKSIGLDKTPQYQKELAMLKASGVFDAETEVSMLDIAVRDEIHKRTEEHVKKLADDEVTKLLLMIYKKKMGRAEYLAEETSIKFGNHEWNRDRLMREWELEEKRRMLEEAKKNFDIQFDSNTKTLAEKIKKQLKEWFPALQVS